MFKFNNNHVFTGYLKQLLASFHLPKCRVYTKEHEQQQAEYEANKIPLQNLYETQIKLEGELKEITAHMNTLEENSPEYTELQAIHEAYLEEYESLPARISSLNKILKIIPTVYHSKYSIYPGAIPAEDLPKYPAKMRYAPYLKDGYLQVYTDGTWHDCHASFNNSSSHSEFHKNAKIPYATIPYTYGQKILNYTKNLQIQNTVYDSYTHEYLVVYLRFHRDFANINLMPLYNCFSNRACPHLDISFEVGNNYKVKFKTDQSFETALYKYYMVPVKFFRDYTIAIDSSASIEVCCCIYDEYHNKDEDFSSIPKLTYQCFGDLQFKTPVLYTQLQNLNGLLLDPLNEMNDLCQQEDNLKLILKIPANNNSSIVILEGDYTTYNDAAFTLDADNSVTELERLTLMKKVLTEGQTSRLKSISEILAGLEAKKTAPEAKIMKQTNKTIINYDFNNFRAWEFLTDKLVTPLQLLRTNTGESYPFADRLVEYLVGNVITVNEEIKDNVIRAKTVISANCPSDIYPIEAADGIWEPILQCLTYDYINKNQNVHDINHDILGFIDKDVEKWYAHKSFKRDAFGNLEVDPTTNRPKVSSVETIANIDIYND